MSVKSNSLRKRFINDYSLPIQLFNGDYFDYFVNLYDPLFGITEKLKCLRMAVEEAGGEEQFLAECASTRNDIIAGFKATPAYEHYNTMDMQRFSVPKRNFPENDVFKACNDGKTFTSFDLKQANYQVMAKLDPSLVFGSTSYEDMLAGFTGERRKLHWYLSGSKYFRLVIFGSINPKRQVTMQKYYTNQILDYLLDQGLSGRIRMFTYDEIVIDDCLTADESTKFSSHVTDVLGLSVATKVFSIELFRTPYTEAIIQHFEDKSFRIRCVPVTLFAETYKLYMQLPVVDYDKRFLYERRVAQYVDNT